MSIDDFPNGNGYNRVDPASLDSGQLIGMFNNAPNNSALTVASQVANKAADMLTSGNSQTVAAQITGRDFMSEIPRADASTEAGSNVQANLTAAATADQKKTDLNEVRGQFEDSVEKELNNPIHAARDQAAKDLGYDQKAAAMSFGPASQSTLVGAAATAAGTKFAIPYIKPVFAKAMQAMDTTSQVNDAVKLAGKLNPVQEARLADRMRSLLTPKVDPETGKEVEPPAIPNNLNTDALKDMDSQELSETLKLAALPAQFHPEWEKMNAAEEKLDIQIAAHKDMEDTNEAVLAEAENAGISVEAATIEDAGEILDKAAFVSASLTDGSFRGVKSKGLAPVPEDVVERFKEDGLPANQAEPTPAFTAGVST